MLNENLLLADQRTEQWFFDRSGKFTGSRFIDLLSDPTTKAYKDLIKTIVGDRLSGQYQDKGIDSKSLKHGREMEPYAVEEYELQTGLLVSPAAFIKHSLIPFVGASPDGLIGLDGGLEIKCPWNRDIHLARFVDGMEADHLPQVQGCMWVTGRKWWDFVSFDSRVLPHLRFYRQRIYRDEEYIAKLEKAAMVAEFAVRERLKMYDEKRIQEILIERVKGN